MAVDEKNGNADIWIERDFRSAIDNPEEQETGIVTRPIDVIEKPLEVFYEQIAKRNATGLASVETTKTRQQESFNRFYDQLSDLNFIPTGRVFYGAGSDTEVTFFNCYVMPFVADSREGISDHRKQVMEIMSRGGGVGTNGSTFGHAIHLQEA